MDRECEAKKAEKFKIGKAAMGSLYTYTGSRENKGTKNQTPSSSHVTIPATQLKYLLLSLPSFVLDGRREIHSAIRCISSLSSAFHQL
jgi:hypothetical protein